MTRTDNSWILAFLSDLERYSDAHDLPDLAEDLRLLIARHADDRHGEPHTLHGHEGRTTLSDEPNVRWPARKNGRIH